jgi:hypothetical protein
MGPEESDGEKPARDGSNGVVERVRAGPAEVVAVNVRLGAKMNRSTLDGERLEFFEPGPTKGRVMAAQVRKHAAPDVTILIVHRGAIRRKTGRKSVTARRATDPPSVNGGGR